MRIKPAIFLLCLAFVITGCHFPGITPLPVVETPAAAPSPFPQPTDSILPTPTSAEPEPPPLEPTPVPVIDATFTLQEGGPFYLPNFNHPDNDCNWMGVAGQVFDQEGLELLELNIISGNSVDGDDHNRTAITGLSTAYGLGGYEIQLSDQPSDSSGIYWVQVLDQNSKLLSERIFFDTRSNCEQNLVLVNFSPIIESITP